MSYEIIYGKQFVKLRRTREIIPMLLMGSNNCFDVPDYKHSRGRRARDWSNAPWFNRKSKRLSEKPEVILKNLNADLSKYIRRNREDGTKPADIRNHFGYYGSVAIAGKGTRGTSWSLFCSQFINGIKNALTVEELAKLGVTLYLNDVGMVGDSPNGRPAQVDIVTEQQYFVELKKWQAWQAKTGKGFWLSFHPLDTDEVLRRLRVPKRKAPRAKTSVEQDYYFVLTSGYYGYGLLKYTRRGYRYSFSKGGGKRFMTEKAAETYRQQLLERGRYKADIWSVERIEGKATFLV